MVECRGPVRAYVESGAIFTKEFVADILPNTLYLCEAHHADRVRDIKEESQRAVCLRRAWGTVPEPGARCDDEGDARRLKRVTRDEEEKQGP